MGGGRLDYHQIRPHSAHGGLTLEEVRLNPAARRLRDLISLYHRRTRSTINDKSSRCERGNGGDQVKMQIPKNFVTSFVVHIASEAAR